MTGEERHLLRGKIDRARRELLIADGEQPRILRTLEGLCVRGHEFAEHGRVRPDGSFCCRMCDRIRKANWLAAAA